MIFCLLLSPHKCEDIFSTQETIWHLADPIFKYLSHALSASAKGLISYMIKGPSNHQLPPNLIHSVSNAQDCLDNRVKNVHSNLAVRHEVIFRLCQM